MKDFFISYNQADRNWAEWIAWQLEESGYTTVIQAWDFRPGGNFVLDMQQAASKAERILVVLSPDYLASRFTQPEWAVAFAHDSTGEHGLLLPVRVRECAPSGLLPQIVYIDLVGTNDEEGARDRLLKGVKRERAKPATAPAFPRSVPAERSIPERPHFPGAWPRVWNISNQRNPNFIGRDALLDQIRQTLTSGNAAALTAIHGLGGMGKTQLAVQYAYRHTADYQIIWWIRAEEMATLATDYVGLAEKLDLPQKHEGERPVIIAAVRDWLNDNASWLLVFDNARRAEDLRVYLPQSRTGHVLITSRNPNWGRVARSLEVKVLPREDAEAFLLQRTGQNDGAVARALAEELGDLPLALEQAGAYIETTGTPLRDYLSLFQKRKQALLRRGQPTDYPDTVATTWEMSFQEAQQQSSAAAGLLYLCAFLAPDDIPLSIVRDGAEHLPNVLAEAITDEVALEDSIAALRRYSLIERNVDSLSVHRLVQMVVRDRLPEVEQRMWAEAVVKVVNEAFSYDHQDVRTWPVCAKLLPHALTGTEYIRKMSISTKESQELLSRTALYLLGNASFLKAKELFEQALDISQRIYSPNHPKTAIVIYNIGSVLLEQKEFFKALNYFQYALKIDKDNYGSEHIEIVKDLNGIGTVMREMGKTHEAFKYLKMALDICEINQVENNALLAGLLSNIASVEEANSNLIESKMYFERSLSIAEEVCGFDSPLLILTLNNLAYLLIKLEELDASKKFFERALCISEKYLNKNHPRIAIVLNGLGHIARSQKDFTKACDLYERALAIDKAVFGSNHIRVGMRHDSLGYAHFGRRNIPRAIFHFTHALRLFQAFYGKNHQYTSNVRKMLNGLKQIKSKN